jgi:hypothetical protein
MSAVALSADSLSTAHAEPRLGGRTTIERDVSLITLNAVPALSLAVVAGKETGGGQLSRTTRVTRARAALGGVSLPGILPRATILNACAGPLAARRGVHVSRSPGSVLGRRTPIRDARLALAVRQGQYAACDRLHTLSAGGFGASIPNPKPRHNLGFSGLFSCAVRSANCSPRQLSEASESHFVNSAAPDVFFKLRSLSECAKTHSDPAKRQSV